MGNSVNMHQSHILIVEDESVIRSMLRYALEIAGFSVFEAGDVPAAKIMISKKHPDLIVLDWMLPKISGIDFAKTLKKNQKTRPIPIIFLSAKAAEEDKVEGFRVGADDYVVKPFSPRELIARIQAVLRRGPLKDTNTTLCAKKLIMDLRSQRVTISKKPIFLAPIEFRLLRFFLENPNRVHTRDVLLSKVWGNDVFPDERTVDVHVRRLRKQLQYDKHDQLIETVRGSGYRFSVIS